MTRLLLLIAILLPVGLWAALVRTPRGGAAPEVQRYGSKFPNSKLSFQATVEHLDGGRSPRITNVQVTDLDQDGKRTTASGSNGRWPRIVISPRRSTPTSSTWIRTGTWT